ncbi:MAG TPA: hypothetical protein VEI47_04680 [Gemmatimonadales bacterium]|nr:hypothetical protein [Gemmatimonadales bacterium]
MPYRRFDNSVEGVAKAWRQQVVTSEAWTVVRTAGIGEAQSLFVTAPNHPGGYAKPGKNDPPIAVLPRAAHEKIASDLAYELELPVPPVVLWVRPSPPQGQETYAAISTVPFTNAQMWSTIRQAGHLVERLTLELNPTCSAMAAFDTWVWNTDRHNEGNLLVTEEIVGGETSVVRAAYIDYAYSLSHSWPSPAEVQRGGCVACYPSFGVQPDLEAMSATVTRIESLPDSVIEEVVKRVPPEFISAECRQRTLEGLLARRGIIRNALRTQYVGLP